MKYILSFLIFIIASVSFGYYIADVRYKATHPTTTTSDQLSSLSFSIPATTGDDVMIEDINYVRAQNGQAPLIEDERLNRSAVSKSCDMENYDYFDHKDLYGHFSWHYFKQEGYDFMYAGENLVNFSDDEKLAMNLLVKSETHFKNMISPEYQHVGIGVCGQYVTQHYGG